MDGVEDDFLFAEDGSLRAPTPAAASPVSTVLAPWRVLIVDDDEEVHSVTRYALRKVNFRNRPLELISAFSAAQALTILKAQPDMALVLLDVVMETDDAGLRLVRAIRDDLGNHTVRLILRTGQPGQAPEERVIVDYDVNDYKAKTELTAQKLFTTVIAALRAFDDIVAIETNRHGLRRMIALDDRLRPDMGLEAYAQTVLEQTGAILGTMVDGLVCAVETDGNDSADAPRYRPVAASGNWAGEALPLPGHPLHQALAALETSRQTGAAGQRAGLYLPGPDGSLFLTLLDCGRPLGPLDCDLLGVLAAKVAAGLANIVLYEKLRRVNADLRSMTQTLESRVTERTHELMEANAKLERLASIDSLTGIMNRRCFMEHALRECERAGRYHRQLSLLLIDLDRFKLVNDNHGHAAGDTVIRQAVERAAGVLRTNDCIARYGGEELVVLLPETGLEMAQRVAERVRQAIGATPIPHENVAIPLTASIGVAEWCGEAESLDQLLDRADQALYAAKQGGRDRVELARVALA
ncbi:diguanylate cyclase [Niveispirillum sp. BGYR6]|uniref:diguanylate cyclase n=1 Tax=Niveispirillum sp. BGYR6 TaxID=2971249 RepID=UPI0022B9ABEA|nr:diguanylate cyclase [Niveispirillum sp. BGYR6]